MARDRGAESVGASRGGEAPRAGTRGAEGGRERQDGRLPGGESTVRPREPGLKALAAAQTPRPAPDYIINTLE